MNSVRGTRGDKDEKEEEEEEDMRIFSSGNGFRGSLPITKGAPNRLLDSHVAAVCDFFSSILQTKLVLVDF